MKLRTILAATTLGVALLSQAQSPRYIFYYIGDGMGLAPVTAAQTFNRTILKSDKPLTMMQMPTVGWCLTYSANKDITDSAAAGTALSTGTKTRNGMVGMDPDTVAVYSIAKALKADGWGVGIATSVAPDDATPSAFYAHVPNRGMYYEIGSQMAETDYEFFAGSALRGLEVDGKPTDLLDKFAQNNVQIVYGPEGIADINSRRVLLLGNPDRNININDISFTIDSVGGALTLPLIAQTCLKHLEKTSPEHFFMMIEGGNIDHALHGNDGGTAIKEILNFDQALAVAYDFYLAHPDETLIVVTADHDTGGMSHVSPKGAEGLGLGNLNLQKVSKEAFSNYCKALLRSRMNYTWDDMKQYLADNLGFFTHIRLTEQQEKDLEEQFTKTFEMRNSADQQTLYANFNAFAVDVFRIFNDATGLAFTTGSHSGNPVPVFAVGCGADAFKSLNNNINIPATILRIAGLSDK